MKYHPNTTTTPDRKVPSLLPHDTTTIDSYTHSLASLNPVTSPGLDGWQFSMTSLSASYIKT